MPRKTLTKGQRRELNIRLSNAFKRAERRKYYKRMSARSVEERRATLRRVRSAIEAEKIRLENRDPKTEAIDMMTGRRIPGTGKVRGLAVSPKWIDIAKGQANIRSAGRTFHIANRAKYYPVDSKGRRIKATKGLPIKWYRATKARGRWRVAVGPRIKAVNVRRALRMEQYHAEVRMVRDATGVTYKAARGMVAKQTLWLTPKEKRAMSQRIRKALDLGDKE